MPCILHLQFQLQGHLFFPRKLNAHRMAPKCVLSKADPKTDGILNESVRSYFPFQFEVRQSVGLILCNWGRLRWPQGSLSFQRNKKKWVSIYSCRILNQVSARNSYCESCQSVNSFQNRLWNLLPWRQLKISRAAICLGRAQPLQKGGDRTKPFFSPRGMRSDEADEEKRKVAAGHRGTGKVVGLTAETSCVKGRAAKRKTRGKSWKKSGNNHTALSSLGKAEPIWSPDASLGDWMLSHRSFWRVSPPLPSSQPTAYMKPMWKMGVAKWIQDLPRWPAAPMEYLQKVFL